jgi:hypothetical protein
MHHKNVMQIEIVLYMALCGIYLCDVPELSDIEDLEHNKSLNQSPKNLSR